MWRSIRRWWWAGAAGLGCVWIALTFWVQLESEAKTVDMGGAGPARALVLYHPSREAGFADALAEAVGEGLRTAGLKVERMTTTSKIPTKPEGYAVVAVVSNTYNWAPDKPTQLFLERAKWQGLAAIGLIGGGGSTERSQRILEEKLRATGAKVLGVRPYWILRPNDEGRMSESNWEVARDLARKFGQESGKAALGDNGNETK